MGTRKQAKLSNKKLGRLNQSELLEGCFVFTRSEWGVIASALDRFRTGRNVEVKTRAKNIAKRLCDQIIQYVTSV